MHNTLPDMSETPCSPMEEDQEFTPSPPPNKTDTKEQCLTDPLPAKPIEYHASLQEFCKKTRLHPPNYLEERWILPDNTVVFRTTCTVGTFTQSGEATIRLDSRKIAEYKLHEELILDAQTRLETIQKGGISKDIGIASSPSPLPEHPVKIFEKVFYYPDQIRGTGKFSEVFVGYLEKPIRQIAIKRTRKEYRDDPKWVELDILSDPKNDHNNLVRYHVSEESHGYFYIVIDLADNTLYNWVKHSNVHEHETLVKVCKDIAMGVEKLHMENILHGDITPNNVLIYIQRFSREGDVIPVAKLTDFRSSQIFVKKNDEEMDSTDNAEPKKSAHSKASIKLKNAIIKFKLSSDVIPLGIVFAFVMTGGKDILTPRDNSDSSIQWNLLDDQQLTSLRNLSQVMLSENPVSRSALPVILEHPFFWGYQKSFDFILAVSNDMKNNQVDLTQIKNAYEKYKQNHPHIPNDWKTRLDIEIQKWISEKDKVALAKKLKNIKLRWNEWSVSESTSIEELIHFARNQFQHYKGWYSKQELKKRDLFGPKGLSFGPYFAKTFPELATILYNVLQNPAPKGIHSGAFYNVNNCKTFKLTWNG